MDDATLAGELVRAAGLLATGMLADGLRTDYKTSISDVVSAADHAAEEMIASRLAAERPDDGLVGEEGARRDGTGRFWAVDPVDGTYNFLARLPYWCSAVGLADADGPVVGAVYVPVTDELWIGGRHVSTSCNGIEVRRLADRRLAELAVCTYLNPVAFNDPSRYEPWRAVAGSAAAIRMMGSASVDLASVAGGRLGLFLQSNLQDWDWLPGAALVRGAGGVAEVVEAHGHRFQLAGNAEAVADARTALETVTAGAQ